MKEAILYFLGQGETVEFTNFTVAHIAPILVAVVAYLPWWIRDRRAKGQETPAAAEMVTKL